MLFVKTLKHIVHLNIRSNIKLYRYMYVYRKLMDQLNIIFEFDLFLIILCMYSTLQPY